MKTQVSLHNMDVLKLQQAILLYEGGTHSFATVHRVQPSSRNSAPYLEPGRPLQLDQLKALHDQLQQPLRAEFLPAQVLARTASLLAWCMPAAIRPLFFRSNDPGLAAMNGKLYPHPMLVFIATGKDLYVWAASENQRPVADTRLYVAPYWNVYAQGHVCLGSAAVPETLALDSFAHWEEGFFRSAFTHAAGPHKLTRYRRGFLAMWKSLENKPEFPSRYLVRARSTVSAMIRTVELRDHE